MPPAEGLRRAPARAAERLRRLLAAVPYLVQHPGTPVGEATALFGVSEQELLDDLNLLFVSGLPPYGPGDLIDVDVQEGRIWIGMADYFARPLRLTRSEALALYLRGTALSQAPGVPEAPALSTALAKLADSLGPEALGGLPERVGAAGSRRPVEALDDVRDAAREHERLRIEYYAASTAETTSREIDPEELFFTIGNWYVAAWDHRSDAERLFRVDRIRSVERTGERFEPRGLAGAGRPLYTRDEADLRVRLRLRPEARWVAEYYETEDQAELADGRLEVVLPAGRLEWLERLLLRLGPEAEILEPDDLRSRVAELAARSLQRYRDGAAHG
ncbi:MAG TPA: WYL domain-containing protein [Actinomycetota bacterium]|nr:WYL domain-containing protein [Actinomycetota bacterium]